MLIGVNPILGPEILYTLRSMGHGDTLAIVDSNFPANSLNGNVTIIYLIAPLLYFLFRLLFLLIHN